MPLSTQYERTHSGLHSSLINVGSFEKDGSYPYNYNNHQRSIVITLFDKDFVPTYDSVIRNYKTVTYDKEKYVVPVLMESIVYKELEKVVQNNDTNISAILTLPFYKAILSGLDGNGMMLLGFQYDVEETFKFKTIGVYMEYGIEGTQYGYKLSMKSLQYDQDASDEPTITELAVTAKTFVPYVYDVDAVTSTFTFEHYDSKVVVKMSTLERDPKTGNKLLDKVWELLDTDTSFDSTTVDMVLTMNELNKILEYSLMHIKTFGDILTQEEFYEQSKIMVTK